ncbi:DNA replication complex GINS protein SLD5 [Culicoides brevitarsis]|uniref:DNA replication complex GINS protein SLD5 n=1 Tax=Culicoides brevitarsis TaxID=469753 RepID=UPI00307C6FC0
MEDSFDEHFIAQEEGIDETFEDDDEEHITAEKVLENISLAWQNERLSPELLPHCSDMVELMLGQIAHMEENLQTLDPNDFRSIMHKMELERIRYTLASYLRCRLKKIEEFTGHILEEESTRSDVEKRLSSSELVFAKGYHEITENHLFQVATRHMPSNMQQNDNKLRIVKPNLMSHVVVKVNSETPATIVGTNDEEIDLAPGSLHLLPYQLISELLIKGSVSMT